MIETRKGAALEDLDDFKLFQKNLNVKKPTLLPLQIQMEKEREEIEKAEAEALAA